MNAIGRFVVFGVTAALLGSCGGNSDTAAQVKLPSLMRLEAFASSVSGDQTLECGLDYIIEIAGEISRTNSVVEYVGTMGGGARRSILNPDLSGFAISADAFSEIQILHTLPDLVEINLINVPPNPPGVSSRFWDSQKTFVGRLSAQNMISGDWVCEPLDTEIGGIVDDSLFADGTWFTETIEN